jgi:hypothetical protein
MRHQCSHDENYKFLRRQDDQLAVRLGNPQTAEFQVRGLLSVVFPGAHFLVASSFGQA